MRHRSRAVVCGLALAIAASGCYGPFNLTRRLYQWNGQVGTKWEKEFVFILLAWVPVYGLTVLGDAVVFNSMEFWTGKNPVDPPSNSNKSRRGALPHQKRIARGDASALLTYQPLSGNHELVVQQFLRGEPVGSLRLQRRDGLTVATDAEGRTLFTAQSTPEGGIIVRDSRGAQLAAYSGNDVRRFLRVTQ